MRRCPGCPRRGGRGLAVRMKNFLQCIPPEDKVNRVPLLMHLLIHCSALQYHALHIVLGVFFVGCLCPLSVQPCCALLCSAVCCVQSSSVLWQQWQWRTESCCCRLQGDAHCALSESCTAQRIVVSPPQREPEFVPSNGYLTQHKGLLLSCPECPLRTLRTPVSPPPCRIQFKIFYPQKATVLLRTLHVLQSIQTQKYCMYHLRAPEKDNVTIDCC